MQDDAAGPVSNREDLNALQLHKSCLVIPKRNEARRAGTNGKIGSQRTTREVFNAAVRRYLGLEQAPDVLSAETVRAALDRIREHLYGEMRLEQGANTFRHVHIEAADEIRKLRRHLEKWYPQLSYAKGMWAADGLIKEVLRRDHAYGIKGKTGVKSKSKTKKTSPDDSQGGPRGYRSSNPQAVVNKDRTSKTAAAKKNQNQTARSDEECGKDGSEHENPVSVHKPIVKKTFLRPGLTRNRKTMTAECEPSELNEEVADGDINPAADRSILLPSLNMSKAKFRSLSPRSKRKVLDFFQESSDEGERTEGRGEENGKKRANYRGKGLASRYASKRAKVNAVSESELPETWDEEDEDEDGGKHLNKRRRRGYRN